MPGNSVAKLGEGIDTRGEAGYVLAAPSTVAGRPYRWSVDTADRIAFAPAWLLDLLEAANGQGRMPEDWLDIVTKPVGEGARNDTVATLAGLLFRRMPDPEVALELLVCWHAVKCRPPLPPDELKRTVDSIAAREMRRRGLT